MTQACDVRHLAPISRRSVLGLLGLTTLTACGRGTAGDLGATDAAVVAASARVVSVTESGWQVNGLGHALFMTLRVNGSAAMRVDDLDSILKAIWLNAPGEPNTVELMAFADAAEEKPVDLRTAAEKLTLMSYSAFGQGGVSMLRMWKRYGKWVEPAS